jgi:hypothetical protein
MGNEANYLTKVIVLLTALASGLFSFYCTIVAFIGGTIWPFGWNMKGGLLTGLLWLFLIDPIVLTVCWWISSILALSTEFGIRGISATKTIRSARRDRSPEAPSEKGTSEDLVHESLPASPKRPLDETIFANTFNRLSDAAIQFQIGLSNDFLSILEQYPFEIGPYRKTAGGFAFGKPADRLAHLFLLTGYLIRKAEQECNGCPFPSDPEVDGILATGDLSSLSRISVRRQLKWDNSVSGVKDTSVR